MLWDAVATGMPNRLACLLGRATEGAGECLVVERGLDAPLFADAMASEAERHRIDARTAVGWPHPFVAFEIVCELLHVEVGSPEAEQIRRRGTGLDALRDLAARVDAITVGAPLLLVIDRAEHVDVASARFLSYLARHLEARSVSLLLVAVEVPPGSWVEEVASLSDAGTHRLQPAEAGPGVEAAVAVLGRLGPDERAVAQALAVLGPSASVAAVAEVSEVPVGTVLPTLDHLLEWGLLRRSGSGAGHLLVDALVLDEVPPTRRAQLHDRAADHARSIGESAARVAAHLEQGTPGSRPWAADALRSGAGIAKRAGDAVRAVRWMRQAIEEDAAQGQEVTVPALLDLGRAQVWAGDAGAADTLRLAGDRSSGDERRALRLRLGRQLSQTGRLDEAVEVLDGLLADLDPDDPAHAPTRLQVQAALASACRVSLRLRQRSPALLRQLRHDLEASATDDPSVLGELAYEHSLAGEPRDVVIDLGARAVRALDRLPLAPEAGHVLFLALVWAEDLEGARALCDRMHGEAQMQPLEAHRRGTIALVEGDLDLAVACSRLAAADIEWVAPVLVSGVRAQLARALIRQGDLDGAAVALRLPGGDSRWRNRVTYHPLLLAKAELAAARGEWRRAASLAESCAEFSRAMGTSNPAAVPWQLVAGRALAHLDQAEAAEDLLADAVERARAFGAPQVLAALEAARTAVRVPAPAPPTAPRGGDIARPLLRLLGDTVLVVDGARQRLGDDLVDRTVCIVGLAEHGVHDEQLAESLWPDGDPAVGRNRLRNVLLRVRQRYGPVVERHGRTVALAADVQVDVHEFDRLATDALAAADPTAAERLGRAALEVHGGELCPVHPFEEWASAPRAATRRRWLALVDRMAELAAARGDLATSLALFEQAVAAEPWDEDRYLDAAERLAAAGRPGAARTLLRRCEQACAELGVPPSARHRLLAERHGTVAFRGQDAVAVKEN